MKWLKSVVEFFKDVVQFVKVRSQQKKTYGSIVDDLELLNSLSVALNAQVQLFAVKYRLFPEIFDALKVYSHYIEKSQVVYQSARVRAINNLLAEKDKPILSETAGTGVGVTRSENPAKIGEDPRVKLALTLSNYKPFIASIIGRCPVGRQGDSIIVDVRDLTPVAMSIITNNRDLIAGCCIEAFGEGVTVEFMSPADRGGAHE